MDRDAILTEALKKFPDTPTLTLAKTVYKQHPAQFKSLEVCRSAIRYRRGNKGEKNRVCVEKTSPETIRENGKAGYSMEMPKSIAEPVKPFMLPEGRTLVMSDIHIPYHDDTALSIALEYADKGIDNILLNGDISDFFSVSRWDKNPEERNLSRELQHNRQFLAHLRERFPKARIIYKVGNHEERWERYLWTKAPEICGCEFMSMESILDFSKWGIEAVSGRQKIKAGKNLLIIHGHEIPGAFAPVNFARTLQTNLGMCTIAGHRHQTSEHSFKTANDKFVNCWSLGCLCDMAPDYAVLNKWNHGFAVVELSKNDFFVQNKRIINKVVV